MGDKKDINAKDLKEAIGEDLLKLLIKKINEANKK